MPPPTAAETAVAAAPRISSDGSPELEDRGGSAITVGRRSTGGGGDASSVSGAIMSAPSPVGGDSGLNSSAGPASSIGAIGSDGGSDSATSPEGSAATPGATSGRRSSKPGH